MQARFAVIAVAVVISALPAGAEDREDSCGTATMMRKRREPEIARAAVARTASVAPPVGPVIHESDVYVLPAGDDILRYDHPFRLLGRTVRFVRSSPTAFTVSNVASEYDDDIGTLVATLSGSGDSVPVALSFAFPFYAQSHSSLTVAPTTAITFGSVVQTKFWQYGPLEAAAQRVPMIAPLLRASEHTGGSSNVPVEIWVRQTAASVLLTWRVMNGTNLSFFNCQAKLDASGDFTFSYKAVDSGVVPWGALIVTSGQEPWYSQSTVLAADSDPAGDVIPSTPAAMRDIADIRSVSVRRVGHSNLIEFRVDLGAAIDWNAFGPGSGLLVGFGTTEDNGYPTFFPVFDYGTYYPDVEPPGFSLNTWTNSWDSPAFPYVSVDGATLRFYVLEAHLGPLSSGTRFGVRISVQYPGQTVGDAVDGFSGTFNGLAATDSIETPLETAGYSAVVDSKPIIAAFTLPYIVIDGIWARLKAADPNLTDTNVDAVAIYTMFNRYTQFWATAFAAVGHSGVDGIGLGTQSTYWERKPALMDLGNPESYLGGIGPFVHELGHRWLYYPELREGGSNTRSLGFSHPELQTFTGAAFPRATGDSSPMGGAAWVEREPGTFDYFARGESFSWHELYLMGLASAAEVPPWFYFTGGVNGGASITGATRHDVTIQQFVDAMGPRSPAYGVAPTSFLVPFVFVEAGNEALSHSTITQLSQDVRQVAQNEFAAATGNRGTVRPSPSVEAKFYFVPTAPFVGRTVQFTDSSNGEPGLFFASYPPQWSFGDGATSTAVNPAHVYQQAGTYTVTYTIRVPGCGSTCAYTASKTIDVGGAPPAILATATSASEVFVQWSPVGTAVSYEIMRNAGAGFVSAGVQAGNIFVDTNVSANTGYLYKVRAFDAGGAVSPFSPVDGATTVAYAESLDLGVRVRRSHVTELRTAVNALRVAAGLAPFPFTNDPLTAATPIRAIHLSELRAALDAARSSIGMPPFPYTDPSITAHATVVKAVHWNELRAACR